MKTWLIQAHLIFKTTSFDLNCIISEQDLKFLNDKLEEQLSLLFQLRFQKLYCICLLHQAGILYNLNRFKKSRDKILECVNSCVFLNDPEISRKIEHAKFLVQEIIKNQNSNLLVFASSNPLAGVKNG